MLTSKIDQVMIDRSLRAREDMDPQPPSLTEDMKMVSVFIGLAVFGIVSVTVAVLGLLHWL